MSTKLDANQVIKRAYDEATGRLRTDAVLNAAGAEIELSAADGDSVSISDGTDTLAVNADGSINVVFSGSSQIEISAADGDTIAINDGTDTLAINADGSIDVKNITGTVSLPTGAATDATLVGIATGMANLWQKSTSGTITNVDDTIELNCSPGNIANIYIHARNTAGPGDVNIGWQGTVDGTNWVSVPSISLNALDGELYYGPSFGDGIYIVNVVGFKKFRAYGLYEPLTPVDIALTGNAGASVIAGVQAYTFIKQASSHVFQVDSVNYATRVDEASSTVTYIGKAAIGSSSANAVWQIKKITISGTETIITYADSDAELDNIWDDRASLTYG
jgi:hypothetical protein